MRFVRLAVLAALGACSYTPPAVTADGAGDDIASPTTFRKRITLTSGSPEPLTDFPVSIVLAAAADLAAHARDDGRDLAFVLPDGTRLDTELVDFDGATGALEAWVRIPVLEAATEIELRYGGEALDPTPGPWTAMFAGVWHLAADGDVWPDSTGAHDVTARAEAVLAVPAPGIIGAGRRFDGDDDTATAGDPPDGSLDFGTRSFSFSAWVHVTQSANAFDMPIEKGCDATPGYCLTLGTANWLVELSDGVFLPTARFGGETQLLGAWHHLVGVVDREAATLFAYTDGVRVGQASIATLGSVDSPNAFSIGSPDPRYRFRGDVDEVRVYRRALDASWIAAEHRNITERASFVVVGGEEPM
jgi:hypothetical protein